ncbi:FYVE zinc finger containing protein [Novymonas esmeraldas]|uniref:FYVE zinc finger containing protein n=1 Tax=Novymonas esmeraldas TaxID=1808958 RepID=A0AAW0ELT2_9TRYP
MLHPQRWRDDHSTAHCTACAAAFTLFRCRRHHCRHCGGVFCDACTEKRLWLRPWSPPALVDGAPPDVTQLSLSPPTSSSDAALQHGTSRGSRCSSSGGDPDAAEVGFLTPARPTAAAGEQQTATTAAPLPESWASPVTRHASAATRVSAIEDDKSDPNSANNNNNNSSSSHSGSPAKVEHGRRITATNTTTTTTTTTTTHCSGQLAPAAVERAAPSASQDAPLGINNSLEAHKTHHSRRASSTFFSVSLYAISPSTATGDVSSQAWATPDTMACLGRGNSAIVGARTSDGASSKSDSLLNGYATAEHRGDARQQLASPGAFITSRAASHSGGVGTCSNARGTPATAAATSARGTLMDPDTAEVYRRESYKVELDVARCVTWYLCRVCRTCHDHLLDSILDAHEAPSAASTNLAAALHHGTAALPVWCYVRLSSASDVHLPHTRLNISTSRLRRLGGGPQGSRSDPTDAATEGGGRHMWASAWARFRASVSLPVSRAASSSPTSASTPPSLRPRDVCSPRGVAGSHRLSGTDSNASTTAAAAAAAAEAAQSSSGLSDSEFLSPVSLSRARGDSSILSPSATSLLASPRHDAAPAPRAATPPRRRIISIDGSAASTRQAVALARRRRRIAVLLIDERDLAGPEDDAGEAAQPHRRAPLDAGEAAAEAAQDNGTDGARRATRSALVAVTAGIAPPQRPQRGATAAAAAEALPEVSVAATAAPSPLTSPERPKLSILVDDATLGGAGEAVLPHGPPPAAWLLPLLPHQAAARVSPPGPSTATPHDLCSPAAVSRPISCASVAPPVAAATPTAADPPSRHDRHAPPALPASPDAGLAVLRALFWQVGAVVHLATTPATTAGTTPTPNSAIIGGGSGSGSGSGGGGSGFPAVAHGVPAASGSGFLLDPAGGGSAPATPMPRWGTGPASYAAQRQALVHDMVARYQLAAAGSLAELVTSPLTAALAGSGVYPASGDAAEAARWARAPAVMVGGGGSGSGSGSLMHATGPRTCGGAAMAAYERVTAPVTTFFQLRPAATAAPAATILPVTTHVEVVGIPISTAPVASAPAWCSATPAVTATPCGVSTPGGGAVPCTAASIALASGCPRPFTLAELLPRLAKLSTNLDGYVVVVLRRHSSRHAGQSSRTSPVDTSGGDAHAITDWDAAVAMTAAERMGGRHSGSGGASCATSPGLLREEEEEDSPRTPVRRDPVAPHRRHRQHRVTELFGGQHLRLLFQQLQSCGVTQPAIGVVEVTDEAEPGAAAPSPASVVSATSPVEAPGLVRDEAGTASGRWPAATITASPKLSALSASGVSTLSSTDSVLPPPTASSAAPAGATAQRPQKAQDAPTHSRGLERLQLPASVVGTRHHRTSVATPVLHHSLARPSPSPHTTHKKEARLPATAQERAAVSLRSVSRQLGVSVSHMTYASSLASAEAAATTPATPFTPRPKTSVPHNNNNNNVNAGGGGGPVLARALESLVTTLVYRDIGATLSQ